MPQDQTPPQPQAQPPEDEGQPAAPPEQVFAGENGDPIWEPAWGQPQGHPGTSRAERLRRAGREPEGKLQAGKLIDLSKPRPWAQSPKGQVPIPNDK
jgi:hypothetical protein